jgi:Tol biopolymer transport system component
MLFCVGFSTSVFAQFNEAHVELNWFTIETAHFYVHYHEGTERTARIAAKVAEEVYGPLTAFYGHEPDTKVSLIIKDVADYSNGAAYYFDNKIEIWANPLDFDLRGTHNWLRNVVSHEFTHIVQSQVAMKFSRKIPAIYLQAFGYEAERRPDVLSGYPNVLISYPVLGAIVPAWFSEGTAQFNRPLFGYETWDAHRDMILRMRALDGKLLTFREMATFGKTTLGNESSYNQGYALTSYIAGQYGDTKLREISANMQGVFATSIDGAISKSIGISTDQLFKEWSAHLKESYTTRVASIMADRREGDTAIEQIGYMNLYPVFSPDGSKFAYISNKTSDYTAEFMYVVDRKARTEERIPTKGTVYSRVAFSKDGKRLLYARRSPPSIYGDRFFDVFEYDLDKKEERRLTELARATAPIYSADEQTVYCLTIKDGTSNIAKVAKSGGKLQLLTHFKSSEQIYNPTLSVDGRTIYFDYALRDERELAKIDTAGNGFEILTPKEYDVRSPSVLNEHELLVSSNKTGIFNIYKYDLATKAMVQQTNVVGGAFMPSGRMSGDTLALLFSDYTSDGYKIHQVTGNVIVRDTSFANNEYSKDARDEFGTVRPPFAVRANMSEKSASDTTDWKKLRSYDDRLTPEAQATPYKNVYNGLSFVPVLRYDNYNPKGSGLDNIWFGLYAFSSDVLGRLSLSAGAVINKNFERDLFAGVSTNTQIFSAFDFFPLLDLNVSNSTRSPGTLQEVFGIDTVNTNYSINFLTFDGGITHPIFASDHFLKLGYTYSIYTSRTEQFLLPSNQQTVGSSNDDYFKGSDLSLSYWTNQIGPTRTETINPIGWYLKARVDLENDKLLRGRTIQDGLPVPNYSNYNFLRLDAEYDHSYNLFSQYDGWGFHIRAAGLFNTAFPVDSFFHMYAGGIAGVRGYPYYALSGTHLMSAQLRYLFPISNNLDTRVLQLYFDKLYFGLFADAAVAFSLQDGESLGTKFKDQVQHSLRRDVGAELRLETFSWYSVPTAIFVSAAYGLDQFTFQARRSDGTLADVSYGHEMRYYAGVLFTFNFSQPAGGQLAAPQRYVNGAASGVR